MSRSSKNSSTATAEKKPDQTDGGSGTMTVTTSGSSNQVNPFQAIGQNGGNVTVGGTYHAPSGDPTRGRDIPIGTGQKGGIMNFKISGSANLVSPIQAIRNSGESFTINNSYPAPGNGTGQQGNPTRDIPIGTGQKGK